METSPLPSEPPAQPFEIKPVGIYKDILGQYSVFSFEVKAVGEARLLINDSMVPDHKFSVKVFHPVPMHEK